jgi:hypothetical protein
MQNADSFEMPPRSPAPLLTTHLARVLALKPVIYAIALLWLALAGSQITTARMMTANGHLAAVMLLYAGYRLGRYGAKPLTWPLCVFWLLVTAVTLASGPTGKGLDRLYLYAILIGVYHLPIDLTALNRSAFRIGWLIMPLSFVIYPNPNIAAMAIWAIFWVGFPEDESDWKQPAWASAGIVAMLATNSEGGMLALLGGGAVYTWARLGRSKSFGLGLALIGLACVVMVTAAKVNDEGSFGLRLVMYRTALADIQAAPIWGHGAHTFQSFRETGSPLSDSEHNLALTLARETGLAGLLVVGWLVFRATRLQKFSALSLAFIGAFVIHSMVDGPLYANFLGAIGLFLVLGGSDERH